MKSGIGRAAVAAAGALAAGCAPIAPVGGVQPERSASGAVRQCFSAGTVNGFSVVDRSTVDLNVGASRIYRVELLGTCPDLRSATGVGVRARTGSSFVCDDLDVELIVPSESRRDARVCPATGLRRLTEAEVAAKRGRP